MQYDCEDCGGDVGVSRYNIPDVCDSCMENRDEAIDQAMLNADNVGPSYREAELAAYAQKAFLFA